MSRISLSVAIAILLGLASFSCDSGSGTNSQLLTLCQGVCDVQGNATGCSASFDKAKYVSDCKGLCVTFLPAVPSNCTDAYTAMYTCQKSAQWVCPGMDLPQPDNNACQSEMSTAAGCK